MAERKDRLMEPLRVAVGGRSASMLEKHFKMRTVDDLLRHYPRRYLELGELTDIDSLPLNEQVSLVAEVKQSSTRPMRSRNGLLLNVVITDGKANLDLTFFNGAKTLSRVLKVGTRALFTGKVTKYQGHRQLAQPMYELIKDDDAFSRSALDETLEKPFPIYPATEAVSSGYIRRCVQIVLDTLLEEVMDPLPAKVRLRRGLIDLRSAFHQIHRPDDITHTFPALRRLKFEEAFILQTALARRKAVNHQMTATARYPVQGGLLDGLDARLPFTLTDAQVKIGDQIADDLAQSYPMHRLLQGEVGSGKTLVALRAMLTVVDDGGQAALLAPTEVLAAQHHRSITAMLGDLAAGGMLGGAERATRVALLTGSLPAAARRKALLDAACGEAGIVIGTHALLQDKVQFQDLGLVVVDEQHRFGVEQRDALRDKGVTVPHLLVMTATPIPRTVAMTTFGDLETSTLDELPPGRSQIVTHLVRQQDERWMQRVWQRIGEEAARGHQSYVVCPRIGDLDQDGLDEPDEFVEEPQSKGRPSASVLETLAELRELPVLRGLVIEALHGRMPADDRDDVMRRFTAGQVHILVATTVIEVGVDVANATAMVVLDADRFGVSQLHQLRGRVGRGTAGGLCLLVAEPGEGPAADRLTAVASTTDGFALALIDLEQRREGDVLGSAQSGVHSSLKLLRVRRDETVIAEARQEAALVIAEDPHLKMQPALVAVLRKWLGSEQAAYLERG